MRLRDGNSAAEEVTSEVINEVALEPAELSDSSNLAENAEVLTATALPVEEAEQIETVEQREEAVLVPSVKMAKQVRPGQFPLRMLRKVLKNPNLGFQLMVIILTLSSENVQMDRRIDGMSSTVDRIRNITDVLNNTMSSVKSAAEAPKAIRRLLE